MPRRLILTCCSLLGDAVRQSLDAITPTRQSLFEADQSVHGPVKKTPKTTIAIEKTALPKWSTTAEIALPRWKTELASMAARLPVAGDERRAGAKCGFRSETSLFSDGIVRSQGNNQKVLYPKLGLNNLKSGNAQIIHNGTLFLFASAGRHWYGQPTWTSMPWPRPEGLFHVGEEQSMTDEIQIETGDAAEDPHFTEPLPGYEYFGQDLGDAHLNRLRSEREARLVQEVYAGFSDVSVEHWVKDTYVILLSGDVTHDHPDVHPWITNSIVMTFDATKQKFSSPTQLLTSSLNDEEAVVGTEGVHDGENAAGKKIHIQQPTARGTQFLSGPWTNRGGKSELPTPVVTGKLGIQLFVPEVVPTADGEKLVFPNNHTNLLNSGKGGRTLAVAMFDDHEDENARFMVTVNRNKDASKSNAVFHVKDFAQPEWGGEATAFGAGCQSGDVTTLGIIPGRDLFMVANGANAILPQGQGQPNYIYELIRTPNTTEIRRVSDGCGHIDREASAAGDDAWKGHVNCDEATGERRLDLNEDLSNTGTRKVKTAESGDNIYVLTVNGHQMSYVFKYRRGSTEVQHVYWLADSQPSGVWHTGEHPYLHLIPPGKNHWMGEVARGGDITCSMGKCSIAISYFEGDTKLYTIVE